MRDAVIAEFRQRFGGEPSHVVRAPGRVNLIGEHTDYNDGFVMPMAIDRAIWIALATRADSSVRVYARNRDETAIFDVEDTTPAQAHAWWEYLRGVAWALRGEEGLTLRGWEGVVAGDVPAGAGLSSSAALEMATVLAFGAACSFKLEPARMAQLGQLAENKWVGMNCGIMDQLASAGGRAGHALLIDCRTLAVEPVALPPGVAIAILDTDTRHSHVSSGYNERRAQCEAAVRHYGVKALRDLTRAQMEAECEGLDDLIYRRCRHVVTENTRVLEAAKAMAAGDKVGFGRLMDESHLSMRDDYEISCPELDAIVEIARAEPGCHGARMTGGGFGGCAVALIDAGAADTFAGSVAAAYYARTGLTAQIYVTEATDGAGIA